METRKTNIIFYLLYILTITFIYFASLVYDCSVCINSIEKCKCYWTNDNRKI